MLKESPSSHLPFLDGLRGIAILWVFFVHVLGWSFGISKLPWDGLFLSLDVPSAFFVFYPAVYGFAGVAMFFVISGFCVHLSHMRQGSRSWGNFLTRRFFRVYPPYLLSFLLFFFVWPWASFSLHSPESWTQLVTHFLLIHNVSATTLVGINPSLWSIAVEFQLYLLYPLLFTLTTKLSWRVILISLGLLELLIKLLTAALDVTANPPLPAYITASPFGFWFSWSTGVYLADCYLKGVPSVAARLRIDIMAVLAFCLPMFRLTEPLSFPAFAVLTALVIDRFLSGKWVLPGNHAFRLMWSHLSFLGVVSYSFYLLHGPFLSLTGNILWRVFPNVEFTPFALFICGCTWYPFLLVLSAICYQYIEKNSVKVGKLLWSKKSRIS